MQRWRTAWEIEPKKVEDLRMGIWIRSQSDNLYEVICIERDRQDNQAVTGTLSNDRTVLLGGYSSVKKKNTVIDMIEVHINDVDAFTMSEDGYYHDVRLKKVFQMPLDSEVVADET